MSIRSSTIQRALAAATVLAVVGLADAGPRLKVGDAAPPLGEVTWVMSPQGTDVNMSDGKVHVLEFWATWCRPCKFSIPHLSRLQQEWGEDRLQIIGITDEEEEDVTPWVDRNVAQIKYGIAISGNRGPQKNWFKAAKLESIPSAFIVGPRGKIQFIGNPNDELFEVTLIKVLKGRFDAVKQRQAAPLMKDLRRNLERKNWRQYEKIAKEIVAISPKIFIDTQVDLFETQLVLMKDPEAAYAGAKAFVETKIDSDPEGVLILVDRIVNGTNIPEEQRQLDFALEVANNALERFEKPGDQAHALKAIASVHFKKGDISEAVRVAKEAYRSAPAETKDDYRTQWMAYKQHVKG